MSIVSAGQGSKIMIKLVLVSRCWAPCSPLLLAWSEQSTAPVWPRQVWLLDPNVSWPMANGNTLSKTSARECSSHHHASKCTFLNSGRDTHKKTTPPLQFLICNVSAHLCYICVILSSATVEQKSLRAQTGPHCMSSFLIFIWEAEQL